ncbi:pilus assembly protein [Thalassobaculum fulvum]|jgi:uncharacterized Ntn-hydrolase superfamily protein|uniref:Pilus assembly protein n=1 Tax=Thalassobaculum fulvum TaxID=1633335 RepID=A0A918XSN5_9PROT|nr:DUF1028 domain-containing protein [Thalassobaculum fulvum]GHD51965.1 pilus assembly protein [Thalassobaculum fulvum]
MTWSIIAREPETGVMGLIVATRFFAAGALVPHSAPDAGLVATQALVNPTYGPLGLEMLRAGRSPEETVAALIGPDEGRAARQVHAMSLDGRTAAFTGGACVDWAGSRSEQDLSVAGNMLAGPAVVEETFETFRARADLPLVDRLIAAMRAGEAAGGDKRGKQSAGLVIQDARPYRWLDLRVDDHQDPLSELERLHTVAGQRFLAFRHAFPTAERPWGIWERSEVEAMIAERLGG